MPKKRNPAKARRIERKQLKPEDMEKFKEGLQKLGDNIKSMMEKRKELDSVKEFSKHVEDINAEHYGLRGVLSKPEQQMVRGDRIQWYWPAVEGISVIATYVTKDSVYEEDKGRHGASAGQWAVDVVGPSGSALFQLPAETAKTVADFMLSAVGWEFAWRDYFGEYGEFEERSDIPETPEMQVKNTAEGSLGATVTPIYRQDGE